VHDLPAATAMLLTLRVHPSRAPDLIVADEMFTDPPSRPDFTRTDLATASPGLSRRLGDFESPRRPSCMIPASRILCP